MSQCKSCWSFFRRPHRGAIRKGSNTTDGTCWVDGTKTKSGWTCGMHSDNYPKHHSEIAPDLKEDWFTYNASRVARQFPDQ